MKVYHLCVVSAFIILQQGSQERIAQGLQVHQLPCVPKGVQQVLTPRGCDHTKALHDLFTV